MLHQERNLNVLKYMFQWKMSLRWFGHQKAVDTSYIATVQTGEAPLPHPCVLWV